jgi:hypothetical protein
MSEQELIPIKVNGKVAYTFIDKDGTQRFIHNKIIAYFTRCNKEIGSLNKLADMTDAGLFSVDDLRLIYQNNGYDLDGYSEIFPKDVIENPHKS